MKHSLFASVLSLAVASVSTAAVAQTQVTTQAEASGSFGVSAQVTINQPNFGYAQPGMVAQPALPAGGVGMVAQPARPPGSGGMYVGGPMNGQPLRGPVGPGGFVPNRDQREVRDDFRDLRRFQNALNQFDMAVQARDVNGVHIALSTFVQMGRAEVTELQREVQLAAMEASRSTQYATVAVRPGYPGGWNNGRRGAVDDRRDFAAEQMRLQQTVQILNQLEQAANANYTFGPQMGILMQARSAMTSFVALAQQELQASLQEMREDRRGMNQPVFVGQPPMYNTPPAPVYVAQPPVVVAPAPVFVGPGMGRRHGRGHWR